MNSLFGWSSLATVRENPIASGRGAWHLDTRSLCVTEWSPNEGNKAGFTVAAFLNLGSAYPAMGQKSLTGEKD